MCLGCLQCVCVRLSLRKGEQSHLASVYPAPLSSFDLGKQCAKVKPSQLSMGLCVCLLEDF